MRIKTDASLVVSPVRNSRRDKNMGQKAKISNGVNSEKRLRRTQSSRSGAGRVLVLGLGNILLKDEGVGVHIAQRLQELALADNVEVMDCGTASLDVLLLAPGIEKLVVIDALRANKEAGTIYKARLKTEEQDKLEQIFRAKTSLSSQTSGTSVSCSGFSSDSRISLHQIGLIDALAVAERINCAPKEIVIIGVEPEKIDCGLELTDKVKQRVPEIINTVLKEIEDAIHTK